MKFFTGLMFGVVLTMATFTLFGQSERAMHPRIMHAIEALRDARTYMAEAPHNFGGHKAAAMRATDDAIRQLELALRYRAHEDHR